MNFSKMKAIFLIIVPAAFLLTCGSLSMKLHSTLIKHMMVTQEKSEQQISLEIPTNQAVFLHQTMDEKKIHALSEETGKTQLNSLVYANLSGTTIIHLGDRILIADKPDLNKTAGHVANTSVQVQQSDLHETIHFAHTHNMLLLSVPFLLILTIAFVLASIYFFKWKRFRYEAKIRCEEQKKYFTYFDTLTNLPNRKGILKQFSRWVENCCKNKQSGGMLLLDVDGLQSINNTFGHDAGDQLLCEAASRLKRFATSQDIVGRIGSDEFAILFHGVDSEGKLEFLINKAMKIFHEPYLINGIVIQLSCSVGAMLISCNQNSKEEPLQFDDVLGKAEYILTEAKKTRKGSYVLFNEDYKNRIERQLWLERALKFSIEKGELFCCFQPQYNCKSKTITGFETLARWKTTEFGMIPPIQFIPMAEKSGFIKELGRYMIENAFAFAKKLQGRGITVSFNASPMELLGANYADYIISRYQYYGLTPNSVAVEITESCLIESFDKVTTKLQILRRHGIQIHLDDFGTGFSSLNYLKNLPIDAVKIDKSFINEIATDDVEKDIVRMIISLAHRLKLKVIAEGVETEDQMKCVLQAGCHLIQGYLISEPVEEEKALLLLGRPGTFCSTAEANSESAKKTEEI
ncbi:MAG: hypothetical protein ACFWUC_01850 [Oscillospiraceae bacterium]|jgi:diguanylate cyclase (GGDEF)-like protein